MKKIYLQRLYLVLIAAFALAYFPPDGWFVRWLCIILYGMLAAWTERAALAIKGETR